MSASSCFDHAQLAALASDNTRPDNTLAEAHTAACERCRLLLAEQREIRHLARELTRAAEKHAGVAPLTASRRDELAAEVMAMAEAADDAPAPSRGRWFVAVGAAAIIVLVAAAALRRARDPQEKVSDTISAPAAELAATEAAREPSAAITAADIPAHAVGNARPEVVRLRDGEVSIQATIDKPVTVVAGDTSVLITARAKIVAVGGVIVTAHVFAGNAQIETAGSTVIVEAGDVWTRDDAAASNIGAANAGEANTGAASTTAANTAGTGRGAIDGTADPADPMTSLTAFRTGWQALRAGNHAAAIAAFDRATDEVVAEDAAFWAAIASERAGDRGEAERRLRAFVARFPGSPRIDAARSALQRVIR